MTDIRRYSSWVIASGQGPEDADAGKSLADYWSAEKLGRWHLTFANDSSIPVWVQAIYRDDVFSDPIAMQPAIRVSPGRLAVFGMERMIRLPEWPRIDSRYVYRHLPEYDLALAYAGGKWWVIEP